MFFKLAYCAIHRHTLLFYDSEWEKSIPETNQPSVCKSPVSRILLSPPLHCSIQSAKRIPCKTKLSEIPFDFQAILPQVSIEQLALALAAAMKGKK
jgi:hypothetical protein